MLGSLSGLTPAAESLGPVGQVSHTPLPLLGAPCQAHPHCPHKHALLSLVLPADRSLLPPPPPVTLSWLLYPVLALRTLLCCRESPVRRRLTLCFDRFDSGLVPPGLRLAESRLGPVVRSLPRGGAHGGWPAPRALTSPLSLPLLLQGLSCVRQC